MISKKEELCFESIKNNLDNNCPHILSEENGEIDLSSYKNSFPEFSYYYNTISNLAFCIVEIENMDMPIRVFLSAKIENNWTEVKNNGIQKFLQMIEVQKVHTLKTIKEIEKNYY